MRQLRQRWYRWQTKGVLSMKNRFTMSQAGETCINWGVLEVKRKFAPRSATLCELPTIAGLEQT